ncbi:MAG: 50S ribosomal protein L13 [Candidatus Omnitrophica bacterium]|nr:50S ribosomal protein L13 [Candidatus Omnitrophota bacterium]
MKTYLPKAEEIKRQWYLIDAQDKILGRLASKVAVLLRGKHKRIFTPHIDTGDFVIVINASGVKLTGRKAQQKIYRRYSGYPGGLREVDYASMLEKRPTTVIRLAVERMLPKGALGTKTLSKLKVYAGSDYPHKAQKPELLKI